MADIEVLKPCPFCGGKCCICQGDTLWIAHCQDCDCQITTNNHNEPFLVSQTAVKAWNTRPDAPDIVMCKRGHYLPVELWGHECPICKHFPEPAEPLKDGEPCSHPGYSGHLSHPCEVCGRIGMVTKDAPEPEKGDK